MKPMERSLKRRTNLLLALGLISGNSNEHASLFSGSSFSRDEFSLHGERYERIRLTRNSGNSQSIRDRVAAHNKLRAFLRETVG